MTANKNRMHVNIKSHFNFRLTPFQQRQQAEEEECCLYTYKPTMESIMLQSLGKNVPSLHLFSRKLHWCLKHFDYLSFRVLQFLNFFFDFHLKHLFHFHFHFFHFGYMLPPFLLHLCQRAPAINPEEAVS